MKKQLLECMIKDAAQAYYEGNTKISDEQFDKLVDELRIQDPKNALLHKVGWGADVNKNKNVKIAHKYGIVGSLGKIHSIDEIPYKFRIVITAKLDGSTCVAHYENGVLVYALTRGDGIIGIYLTEKYRYIISKYDIKIPKSFTGDIRGEIVFNNHNWNIYKEKYPDAKLPRNISTGLFMSDDITDDLGLVSFVPYKIHGTESHTFIEYTDILYTLQAWGFETVPSTCIHADNISLDKLYAIFTEWSDIYPIDGLVLDNRISQHENGWVEYDDIAFKFAAENKIVNVQYVSWELSKNNVLIPIIHIEPTMLSGALVSKCTGFNYKYIIDNKIGINSRIKIMRSGEVIPHFMEVVESTSADYPKYCPVCHSELVQDGVHLKCINADCGNIKYSQMYKWLEVIGVRDMLGVGPALLDQIITELSTHGIIDVEDLYCNDLSFVQNILTPANKKKWKCIITNLSQPVTTAQVILAANIMGIGNTHCNNLGDIIYDNIDDINKLTTILKGINGIGDFVVKCVLNAQFRLKRLFTLLPVQKSVVDTNNAVRMYITVTGSLSVPRKQFEMQCKQHGVVLTDNIKLSKYLVTNNPDPTSSKGKKAKQYNIPIITEIEFSEVLKTI